MYKLGRLGIGYVRWWFKSFFVKTNFSKYFIFSILDDGVLSHKEFVVVMKNQLVRGLENVITFVKENILSFKNWDFFKLID